MIFKPLINYWICEGFLDEFDSVNGVRNQGYNIIGTLLNACLLEESTKHSIKMHDVIRDMALWIANECGKEKHNFFVRAGARLTEVPKIWEWSEIKRLSFMNNNIKEVAEEPPTCQNLLTLFLNDNSLTVISSGFFKCMPALRVLDLSNNKALTELPLEVCKLLSLEYLNLSAAKVRQLPNELRNLHRLKYLNLNNTSELDMIPKQVISSFSMLKILSMFSCGYFEQVGEDNVLSFRSDALVEELESLQDLNELSLTIRSVSMLKKHFSSQKLCKCTQGLFLQFLYGSISVNVSSPVNMMPEYTLQILDLVFDKEPYNLTITHESFQNLHVIQIERCPMLRDVTWLVFAQSLESLAVAHCCNLEEVISGAATWVESAVEGGNLKPLAKIQSLKFDELEKLKTIYNKALPLSSLKSIKVRACPNLKKLPLNSNSFRGSGTISINRETEWWENLEWEDEGSRAAVAPSFRGFNSNE